MTNAPKTLTNDEVTALLDCLLVKIGTINQKTKGLRNYAMGLLMVDTGLRVGEVVQLVIGDFLVGDTIVQSLRVRAEIAKKKSERIIPLSKYVIYAMEVLNKRIWQLRGQLLNDPAISKITTPEKLTTRQAERIIRDAAMKGIGRPVHPHMLRHTFATRLMRVTDTRTVQELLGHRHLVSTQVYTHPNEEDKKSAVEKVQDLNSFSNYGGHAELSPTDVSDGPDTAGTKRDV